MAGLLEAYAMRPDSILVWRDPRARKALDWYWSVMTNRRPARFKIARSVEAPRGYSRLGYRELWELHDKLSSKALERWRLVRERGLAWDELEDVEPSFLDVKVELAWRILRECVFCEKKCRVDRTRSNRGACRLGVETIVSSYFLHMGEEAPLVPSGTIFYGGCTFKCVFCQNYDISQEYPYPGEVVDARRLASIQEKLRRKGARNINHVGGDPTPGLHTIIESFKHLRVNVPQIWNSNQYQSVEGLKLIRDLIDLWLPDFKYWDNRCAIRLSLTARYRETLTRNLRMIVGHGDIIIRHLVMPNHLECCTKPILKWIAQNMPRETTVVNIMSQYRPEYKAASNPSQYPDIARPLTAREYEEAKNYAEELGLLHDLV